MVQGIVPVTGIVPENQPGVRLHEACGFQVVGVRERLGKLYGRWRDVSCWSAAARPSPDATSPVPRNVLVTGPRDPSVLVAYGGDLRRLWLRPGMVPPDTAPSNPAVALQPSRLASLGA
jgi:hypothetical protein